MITVLVTYKLPEAMNRAAAHALSEQVAPRFQVLEGLRMKHFLYHEEQGLGGGFYTWDTREAADTFHTETWLDSWRNAWGRALSCNTSRRRLWWTTTPARFG